MTGILCFNHLDIDNRKYATMININIGHAFTVLDVSDVHRFCISY